MPDTEEPFISKYAIIIMALATVVPPFTTFLYGVGGHDNRVSVALYALFWAIYPPESAISGLQMVNYYSLTAGLSLGFFNILFALQVIRYIRGDAGRRSTLIAGVLTLVIPIISSIVSLPIMLSSGYFVYIGPIPIQLITGLLLMRFAGPKEITAPW